MDKTINKIFDLTKTKSLVLNLVADNHLMPTEPDDVIRHKENLANIAYLNSHIHCDGLVHVGDMISGRYSSVSHATEREILKALQEYVIAVANSVKGKPCLVVGGNHDGKFANTFYARDWYNIGENFNDSYVTRKEGTPYYYYDFEHLKVRIIAMQVPDGDDYKGYSVDQLNWLANEALDMPIDYRAFIIAHIPNFTVPTETPTLNKTTFEGIINAFNSKGTFADSNISVEFTNYTNQKVLAMFCGHDHRDYISLPNNQNGDGNYLSIPVILTGLEHYTSTDTSGQYIGHRRDAGTYTQDLWDTIVYNFAENKIYMVRFGAGDDRVIQL